MTGILNILAGSISSAIKDGYFNLVTLLLPGNGTNGSQNNTFLDSSSNNFTITRNGNTTQGTFSPFSQTGWSNYFNGSSDYLSIAANTAFNFGTGDATVEFWFNSPGTSNSYPGIISAADYNLAGTASIRFDNTGYKNKVFMYINGAGGGDPIIASTSTIAYNTWNHIAITRSGTSLKLYLNGVLDTTVAIGSTVNWNMSNGGMYIGRGFNVDGAGAYFPGYVSNVRLVKGSVVYTANFTPSTTPLTAITNTSLLTCQSNRFIDNSSNAFAITVGGGTPSVQAFSPFAPTAAYSAATNGGSGYFDGSGDILSVASNAVFALPGDFTVECWVYPLSFTNMRMISVSTTGGFALWPNNSGFPVVDEFNVGAVLTSSIAMRLNSWNHVAAVRSGTTITVYVNGASGGSVTSSKSFVQGALYVGGDNFGYNTQGYVSGFRWIKGSAVAPSGAPTAPPTAITNTQLLLNFTNGGIIDATGKNVLETVGNAQISTTQSKFGGSSMYFDGTGDYLVFPDMQTLAFGTGDFTIEGWMYLANTSGTKALFDQNSASRCLLYVSGTSLIFYANGANQITGGTLSATTWTHFALVRSSGSTKLYVGGTQVGSTYSDSTNYALARTTIGCNAQTLGNDAFNGYLDDYRISKYARYTANFTPPTAAFALQ